jgi:hypothetical protein
MLRLKRARRYSKLRFSFGYFECLKRILGIINQKNLIFIVFALNVHASALRGTQGRRMKKSRIAAQRR